MLPLNGRSLLHIILIRESYRTRGKQLRRSKINLDIRIQMILAELLAIILKITDITMTIPYSLKNK